MKRLVPVLLLLLLVGCTPVMDPSRWDPTTYCRTVQKIFGVDPWCKARGH